MIWLTIANESETFDSILKFFRGVESCTQITVLFFFALCFGLDSDITLPTDLLSKEIEALVWLYAKNRHCETCEI